MSCQKSCSIVKECLVLYREHQEWLQPRNISARIYTDSCESLQKIALFFLAREMEFEKDLAFSLWFLRGLVLAPPAMLESSWILMMIAYLLSVFGEKFLFP